MKCYRVVFARNRIVSCNEAEISRPMDFPYVEQEKGELTFAIIKAPNESQARSIAKYMALELNRKKQA